MEILNVLAATVGAYAFSAVWYTVLSKQWVTATGMPVDQNGKPMGNGSSMPFVIGFVAMLCVAGMMRHVFQMSGVNTMSEGIGGGFGIGAFIITPWMVMNYSFSQRNPMLSLLDGVNSVVGCTIMGLILQVF